jgi:hypothetical protein
MKLFRYARPRSFVYPLLLIFLSVSPASGITVLFDETPLPPGPFETSCLATQTSCLSSWREADWIGNYDPVTIIFSAQIGTCTDPKNCLYSGQTTPFAGIFPVSTDLLARDSAFQVLADLRYFGVNRFWDITGPTNPFDGNVHRSGVVCIVGTDAPCAFAVPEPRGWMLLLAGLALVYITAARWCFQNASGELPRSRKTLVSTVVE